MQQSAIWTGICLSKMCLFCLASKSYYVLLKNERFLSLKLCHRTIWAGLLLFQISSNCKIWLWIGTCKLTLMILILQILQSFCLFWCLRMSLGWVLHFIYQFAECHNADIGLLKKAHSQARALGVIKFINMRYNFGHVLWTYLFIKPASVCWTSKSDLCSIAKCDQRPVL